MVLFFKTLKTNNELEVVTSGTTGKLVITAQTHFSHYGSSPLIKALLATQAFLYLELSFLEIIFSP